jgi:hypothetical protein
LIKAIKNPYTAITSNELIAPSFRPARGFFLIDYPLELGQLIVRSNSNYFWRL